MGFVGTLVIFEDFFDAQKEGSPLSFQQNPPPAGLTYCWLARRHACVRRNVLFFTLFDDLRRRSRRVEFDVE
jgi:hypothetical protein